MAKFLFALLQQISKFFAEKNFLSFLHRTCCLEYSMRQNKMTVKLNTWRMKLRPILYLKPNSDVNGANYLNVKYIWQFCFHFLALLSRFYCFQSLILGDLENSSESEFKTKAFFRLLKLVLKVGIQLPPKPLLNNIVF